MSKPKEFHFKQSVLLTTAVGLAIAGVSWPVLAQDSDEILVTGSRIVRRDFTSQSPIVTIQAEIFENRSNVGLESALNQMPQFQPTGTQAATSAANTPFPQASAAPGAATVNLRGLGLNRTLVLVDGRRVQPVNGQLVVDLNTIPSAAVGSVEVITGGAAAVYGADAIAGVVNLKLRRDFEGLEVDGQFGITQEGDGEEYQVSSLFGANLADGRGNVMIGANYAKREIIYGKERGWVRDGWADPATMGGSINNSNLAQFAVTGSNAPTAAFPLNSGTVYGIDQNGNVFDPTDPLDPAHPYTGPLGGTSGFKVNPDGTLGWDDQENRFLQIPMERYSMFGSAHFDLTDNVELFADMRYAETHSEAQGFTSAVWNVWAPTVPYNPAYDDPNSATFGQAPIGTPIHPVPADLAAILNSRPTPNAPWTFNGGLDYFPNYVTVSTSNVFQVIGGIRGSIPGTDDWTYELYASHGKSTVNAQQPEGFPYLPRLQNLFNGNMYGQGFAVSFPIAVTGACTSGLPIFNADGSPNNTPSTSQDCADYAVLRMNSITTLTQEVIEANVQGSLFELPAGTMQFAVGATYREENFKFEPDSGFNANQDYPNVIQNIILPVTVNGTTNVKELYAELAIPVLSDLPFIQRLEFDPGVRISDYNTAGTIETYKLLGDLAVNEFVRFRGGYQRANRAANVTELFTPKGGSSLETGVDSCGNWAQTPEWGNVPGNPNRLNVQTLCQHLMVRDGAPSTLYEPGTASADNWAFNVFGATNFFPFVIGVTEGNPGLASEKADTYTAGVVFNSPFNSAALERMTLSVDYYQIKITDAIGTPNHNTIYQQCLDAQYNSFIGDAPGSHTGAELAANNPFCALIQREYVGDGINDYGADRKFSAQYINQGGIKSRGIDVQFDWSFDFADAGMSSVPGTFHANVLVSILDLYARAAFPGAEFQDFTGTTDNSSFDYQIFSNFNYSVGPFSIGLRWQHLPGVDVPDGSAAGSLGVKSHDQFDLFGRYAFGERYELRAGIDNLLNADPEIVGAVTNDANLGTTNTNYDQFGRRFFMAFKATF
ncbi:MAG: TonB-dependent receptor [Gammaproteobacteria bacterium]|nr:TonB-dependent receptor [Gammaproteobacteria bacterium]